MLFTGEVFGFGGLKLGPEGWRATPRLPRHWRSLTYRFMYRGQPVTVSLTNDPAPEPTA